MTKIPDRNDQQWPNDPQLEEDETDCAGCGEPNPLWQTTSFCPECEQEEKDRIRERLMDTLKDIATTKI